MPSAIQYVVLVAWTGDGPEDWPSVIGPYASEEDADRAIERMQEDTDTFDSHRFAVQSVTSAS